MDSKIFISYRRSDSQSEAGRLFEHLESKFGIGTVFKDVNSIPGGKDYRTEIRESLKNCAAFLVLLGPNWLEARLDDGSRRIDAPIDWVRWEIEIAIEMGKLVIPILVDDSKMPTEESLPDSLKQLPYLHSLKLRHDPDFKTDAQRIAQHIDESTRLKLVTPGKEKTKVPAIAAIAFLSVVSIIIAGLAFGPTIFSNPGIKTPPIEIQRSDKAIEDKSPVEKLAEKSPVKPTGEIVEVPPAKSPSVTELATESNLAPPYVPPIRPVEPETSPPLEVKSQVPAVSPTRPGKVAPLDPNKFKILPPTQN